MKEKLIYDAPEVEVVKVWLEGVIASSVEGLNGKRGYWDDEPEPGE